MFLGEMTQDAFSRYFSNQNGSFLNFLPEIIITLSIIALVITDLFIKKDQTRWLVPGALFLLFITGFSVFISTASSNISSYLMFNPIRGEMLDSHSGLIAFDGLAFWMKFILIAASMIVVFMIWLDRELEFKRLGEFLALLFGSILGMFIMSSATNLLLIFIGIEISSLTGYLLVAYVRSNRLASEGAFKFFVYGSVASAIMIFGMSIIYGVSGSLYLHSIAATSNANPGIMLLGSLMILFGFAYKVSAFPMHFWAPDAYESASIPVTSFLSVASKVAGFAVLLRFVGVIGVASTNIIGVFTQINWSLIIGVIAILTMFVGNLGAMWQNNLKRLFAFSSIAHAGYILVGISGAFAIASTGSTFAWNAYGSITFYFWVYLFTNLGAFALVLIVDNKQKTSDITAFRGIGYRNPTIGIAMVIILLSLIGLPITGGFIGKLWIFGNCVKAASITAGASSTFMVVLVVIAVINSVISVYYYFRIIKMMYLSGEESEDSISLDPISVTLICVTVIPVVLLFVSSVWGELLQLVPIIT